MNENNTVLKKSDNISKNSYQEYNCSSRTATTFCIRGNSQYIHNFFLLKYQKKKKENVTYETHTPHTWTHLHDKNTEQHLHGECRIYTTAVKWSW